MQKGDIILRHDSPDSVAGVYVGNGKLITKGDGGTLKEQPFAQGKGVAVVLRHEKIDPDKGAEIADSFLKLNTPVKDLPATWLRIGIPNVKPHADVCAGAGVDKDKCLAFAGKINLGTVGNDSFLCADAFINIFEKHQLPFVPLMMKEQNGMLRYFGHLKNKS